MKNAKDIETPIKGGCYCKQVRYEVREKPLAMGVCHCRSCQHLTGGVAWPFVAIAHDTLTVTGDFKEYAKTGASGKLVHYAFCPQCGTTLFGRPEVWPQIKTISGSTLDEPSQFSPGMHVWVKDIPNWEVLSTDIPHFAENNMG